MTKTNNKNKTFYLASKTKSTVKHKLTYILEIIWMIIMISSLVVAIYKTIQTNFTDNLVLYFIALISGFMYSYRRYLRKTREKNQSQN